MENSRQIGLVLLALTTASCSGGRGRDAPVNSTAVPPIASEGVPTASSGRICSLFSAAEIKALLGASVGDGKVTGPLGSACQWDGTEGVYAQIQLINDPQYWEKHTGAKGYAVLRDIGKEAFVASSLGGWEAGTVTDKFVVFVSLSGGSASSDSAVGFLRRTLERLG
jgi:hypothetical protein